MHTFLGNAQLPVLQEETSCGMDRTVSKLYKIVFWSAIHLNKWLVGIPLFVWDGFSQSLDFAV